MKRVYHIVLAAGLLLSCYPFAGNHRAEFVRHSLSGPSQLPDGVLETVSHRLPERLIKYIFDRDYLIDPNYFADWRDISQSYREGVRESSTELLCLYDGGWLDMLYVSFLRKNDSGWSVAWDTVLTPYQSNFMVALRELGIEKSDRPTIVVGESRRESYKERKFFMFAWDGQAVESILQPPACGVWFETIDLDSNGVMELNFPTRNAENNGWINHPFVYASDRQEYVPAPDLSLPGDRGGLDFTIRAVKDTFLSYEPAWIRVFAHNRSGIAIESATLAIDFTFMDWVIRNQDGQDLTGGGVVSCLGPALGGPARLMPSGDTIEYFFEVDQNARPYDTAAAMRYFPPGEYTLTLSWKYEYMHRPVFGGSDRVTDSTTFVVVAPTGEDIRAKEIYRGLRHRWVKPKTAYARKLWDLYNEFPGSPYGEAALGYLVSGIAGGWFGTIDGAPDARVVRELSLDFPENPSNRYALRKTPSGTDAEAAAALFSEICDSVPGTLAGNWARALLKKQGN